MSEPLLTEDVATKTTHIDEVARPFKHSDRDSVAANVGRSDTKPYKYEKISEAHGRSMTEALSSEKLIWGGPNLGDIFGATNIKGSDMTDVKLEIGENGRFDVRAHGLMDDADLPRLIKASEFMRKNGLPTEAIRNVHTLKEVKIKKPSTGKFETISIEEWEDQELNRAKLVSPKLFDEANQYFKETKFIVVERDVQTDKRLEDLQSACKENQLAKFLSPVFKWLNAVTETKNEGVIPRTARPKEFLNDKGSMERFFQDYLPNQMGVYIGRMHKLGVAHGYLHIQNWSAIGTVVEADSVYGKPIYIDDDAPSQDELSGDLWNALYCLGITIDALTDTDEFKSANLDDLKVNAFYNLAHNYLNERFGKIDTKNIKKIEELSQIDFLPDVIARLHEDTKPS